MLSISTIRSELDRIRPEQLTISKSITAALHRRRIAVCNTRFAHRAIAIYVS